MRHLPPPGLQAERRREGASPDPRGILESNTRTGPPTTATPGPPKHSCTGPPNHSHTGPLPQPRRPTVDASWSCTHSSTPREASEAQRPGCGGPGASGGETETHTAPACRPAGSLCSPFHLETPPRSHTGHRGAAGRPRHTPGALPPASPWGPRLSPPPGTSRLRPRLRGRRDPPSLRTRRTRARRVAARRTHARCGPGPGPARRRGLPLARDLGRGPPAPSTHRPPTAPPSPHRLQHPAEHLAQAGAGREPNPGNHGPSPKRPAHLSGTALDTTASRRLRGQGRQGREEETQGQRPAPARAPRGGCGDRAGGPASWGRGRHLGSLPWLKPVDGRRGLRFR